MNTKILYDEKNYKTKAQEKPVDMEALLEEQEWLNFKLGLFAEH